MRMRPYQKEALDNVRAGWKEGNKSTLVVMPTGCGKTIFFSHLIRSVFPGRALVLGHRTELITQAVDKIQKVTGFRCDVEMGEYKADMGNLFGGTQVVVSTIQTQCSGGDGGGRMGKFDPSMFKLLIIDEGHHAPGASYKRIIDYYRNNTDLRVVGVTATPDRADEAALGQIFDTVSYDYEILNAINDGWLVPVNQQMVTVGSLDFSQIRTTAGDLNGGDLARVMEQEENLQGVCSATYDIVKGKRTLIFTASVDHAERISEILNRHKDGCADWVCGKTNKDVRRAKLAKFQTGETQIMVNCGVLTEGYDNPAVEVVVMARPTKSRSLYAQMIGRCLRPSENIASELNDVEDAEARKAMIKGSTKGSALVIDFVGNSGRHKLMTTADILGGKIDDDVIEAAVRVAKERGQPVDMTEILEEEQKRKDAAAAKRMKLVAQAKYAAQFVDPFGVFNIKPEKDRGWDTGRTLSDKQRSLLEKQGLSPDALGYHKGKQILQEIFRRFDTGQCSFKQAKLMKKYGYDPNMSRAEATVTINKLAANGWKRVD